MTKDPERGEAADRRRAKGAARAAIGKLIGDDAAVRDGRAQQEEAGRTSDPARNRNEQE
ncbi:hypothetical protein [Sphingomonas sp. BK580]|uniref:hypothetical protein n=1 Tax=Sphingomonas sp. BK580 TaxID=2586972 RepID=UPI001622C979|nr:hypothetical protein [Sphingomonas sp. BK580]MBB3692546.1 uncharacterized protein YjbJ (UPF0337 family) [Sphingomonas sp. BK580]